MIRKRLKIEELWQSTQANRKSLTKNGDTPLGTIHQGAYAIQFKGKTIGYIHVSVVSDVFNKAKIYVPIENRWEGTTKEAEKKRRHKEWLEVTRIRLGSVKEITCPPIGAHYISACNSCKYCKTRTDHFIDCSDTNVRCTPSGSCEVIRVKNV